MKSKLIDTSLPAKQAVLRMMQKKAEIFNCPAFIDPEMLKVIEYADDETWEDFIENIKAYRPRFGTATLCPHCWWAAGNCWGCLWGEKYGYCGALNSIYRKSVALVQKVPSAPGFPTAKYHGKRFLQTIKFAGYDII